MDAMVSASITDLDTSVNNVGTGRGNKSTEKISMSQLWRKGCRRLATLVIVPLLLGGTASIQKIASMLIAHLT